MSLRKVLALLVALPVLAPAPWAHADDEDEEEIDATDEADAEEGDDEGDADDEGEDEGEPFVKQNLSGHDLGTKKKANLFEKDRFFVDKVDTKKTAKGTLIQGSLASSSFLYTERGGLYQNLPNLGSNAARFSRMFTELRLQTDFRHIGGSRWDARVDARARVVNTPEQTTEGSPFGDVSADPNHVQSGFNGTNEYDIRELWLFRSGKRTDLFLGRQFVPDLGGVKFDGLRFDYAKSSKLTFIGFGGLYPMRGSRSLTTDYPELRGSQNEPAGRFVGAGGFGGAYRTPNAYGAIGGVALVPFAAESPRVFVTSTGYWRNGSTLDVYHFGLVDLVGSQGAGLTNLSLGANYKPSPRLRLTASVNRVDVDTLAVQANAYLADPDNSPNVQNETYFRRLATNAGRLGISAGLGPMQRFEVSTSVAYRYRPSVAIPVGDGTVMPTEITLQATKGVEVFLQVLDRRSFKDLRIGLDATRTIGVGDVAFNRSNLLSVRAHVARALSNGHGEWEAEASYTTTQDSASGVECIPGMVTSVVNCYGSSTGTILQLGGNLFYRINRDWFAMGSVYLSRQTLLYYGNDAMAEPAPDPTVTGLTGYLRAAYRF